VFHSPHTHYCHTPTNTFTRFILFRVQTADFQPESCWAEFGSEVAIKKFDKTQFYAKVKDKWLSKAEEEEECEKLCRKAFDKECEMISRLVYKHKYAIIPCHLNG
jgi:hypothetical protein